MTTVAEVPTRRDVARVAGPAHWLTPVRCRMLLTALLVFDVLGHLYYLNNCPIDLAGDEAQYWDWSRQLDWSYYSKGPLIAYIIRASTSLLGDTMQAVRAPAILFGVGTSLITYFLVRRLFGNERLALGAVAINHIVPLFVAGSVIMTIDPPMFFCWALATLLAAGALFDDQKWAWPLVGLAVGIGFLAKYAAMLWFVGLLLFMWLDPQSRPKLKRPGVWIALAVALLMTTQVIVWNSRNEWMSLRHVARQTGATGGGLRTGNFFEFILIQASVVGPVLALMMVAATRYTFDQRRTRTDPHRRKLLFLVMIGLPFFALNLIVSLFTKAQVNWPAPAYFTLMILVAYYIATRLQSPQSWRPWRWWFRGTVALGLLVALIAHDSSLLIPAITRMNAALGTKINLAKVDPLAKLRGWGVLGERVSDQLDQLGPGAIVLCDDYQQTAEMAFYVRGRPKTFCAGSYYQDAKRYTQYDVWPDRRLDDPALRGRNAIFVGKPGAAPPDIARAFERLEELPPTLIVVKGVEVRRYPLWVGYGFKGMTRPKEHAHF